MIKALVLGAGTDSYPLDLQLQINNRFFLEKKC